MSERELHTVAVFQDASQAEAGLQALVKAGFPVASLSAVAVATEATGALVARVFGTDAPTMDVRGLGTVHARGAGNHAAPGAVVERLQGTDDAFTARGLAATASRIGFQQHDGRIFEQLTARGGVLVTVTTAGRASDALALLHAYGGGNAAIGAWAGRL